MLNKQKITKRS